MNKRKKIFGILLSLIIFLYGPIPVRSQNLSWDENGFCWENCPTLDGSAYIHSFTQIRGLTGYLRLPEVVTAPVQIRGLRIGINNPMGNFWTANGTLVHTLTGQRYPIGLAESSDGNPMGWYNLKCSSTNPCNPDFSFGPVQIPPHMYAGSYHLEIVARYDYGLNPSWSKTIVLPGALVIASSPAGLGVLATPTTSTTVSLPSIVSPVVSPARPAFGRACPYRYGQTRIKGIRAVCSLVNNQLIWRKK
jgi:hypothetical protein